ncbi:MAG: hypothetical protein JW981_02955 [Anaerolineae bacterium]|nr:hypothetical protein [Anaerolineae bacterium]
MEIRQMLKVLLRWWWLALLPVVVVAAYVGLTFQRPPTVYQVVMRFAAGGEPEGLSVDYDRYYPWLASEYIANGLADMAVTGAFAQAVAERMAVQGIEITPAAIQGAIISDNAQSITVIYLTWPDPEQIILLAEAVSAEITENGPAYYPQMGDTGVVARRLDQPVAVAMPPSLKVQLVGPGLKLILATGIGVALAFLAHYLDPTVREREEIEAVGIPVLASLPRK